MTRIFDGMAGLLTDVFGSPVTWVPQGGAPVTVRAVFRQQPVQVATEDGGVTLIADALLRVPSNHAANMRRGDLITLADGRVFRIESRIKGESPAADGFADFTLEVWE